MMRYEVESGNSCIMVVNVGLTASQVAMYLDWVARVEGVHKSALAASIAITQMHKQSVPPLLDPCKDALVKDTLKLINTDFGENASRAIKAPRKVFAVAFVHAVTDHNFAAIMVLCCLYITGNRPSEVAGDIHGAEANQLEVCFHAVFSHWSQGIAHAKTDVDVKRVYNKAPIPCGMDPRQALLEFASTPSTQVALRNSVRDGVEVQRLDYWVLRIQLLPYLAEFEIVLAAVARWELLQAEGKLGSPRLGISPASYLKRRAEQRWDSPTEELWFVNVAGGSWEACNTLALDLQESTITLQSDVVAGPLLRAFIPNSDRLSHMPMSTASVSELYQRYMAKATSELNLADKFSHLTAQGPRRRGLETAREEKNVTGASKSLCDLHFRWKDPGARKHKSQDRYGDTYSWPDRLSVTANH
jgi:hypothetical protein